jgi:hypothetical protein
MSKRAADHAQLLAGIEGQRIVPLKEASRLAGVSVDTLRKHYRNLIVRVGPKRVGMRLGDVLSLGQSV